MAFLLNANPLVVQQVKATFRPEKSAGKCVWAAYTSQLFFKYISEFPKALKAKRDVSLYSKSNVLIL